MLRVNTERRFYPDLKIGVWRRRTYQEYSPLSSAAGRAACSRSREGGGLSATNANSITPPGPIFGGQSRRFGKGPRGSPSESPPHVNWNYPSSLTSIRGKDYLLYAVGCVNAEILRKKYREERKSKFLSLDFSCHFSPHAMTRVQLSIVTGRFNRFSTRLRNGTSCHPKSGENVILLKPSCRASAAREWDSADFRPFRTKARLMNRALSGPPLIPITLVGILYLLNESRPF